METDFKWKQKTYDNVSKTHGKNENNMILVGRITVSFILTPFPTQENSY
jgi:hypothetical protein